MAWKEALEIVVNGESRELAVDPGRTLLDLLRDDLGLTGTKRGCDDASCGACTVLVDGRPHLACIALALCQFG
jgi:carbon-monoxide dehydrogenase small subunit